MPSTFPQALRAFEQAVRELKDLELNGKVGTFAYLDADERYLLAKKHIGQVHDRHQRRFLRERSLARERTGIALTAPTPTTGDQTHD